MRYSCNLYFSFTETAARALVLYSFSVLNNYLLNPLNLREIGTLQGVNTYHPEAQNIRLYFELMDKFRTLKVDKTILPSL
jgi:hypothetical protein